MLKRKTVFTAYITLKNGKRIYARHYGKDAFKFEVDEKEKPETNQEKEDE